jgi:hypothetical protein
MKFSLDFKHSKDILIKNEDRIILAIGFFLVAVLSFGAGKISEVSRADSPIIFQNAPECGDNSGNAPVLSDSSKSQGKIIGNKNSKIYHMPGGASYDKISEMNRIYFSSEADAQKAGYRKAKN